MARPGDLPPPPAVGEPARDFTLPELDGGTLRLEDLRGRPLILTFLRHAGWLFCRTHLVKVLERRSRIESAGGTVLAVVGDEPERVRAGMLRELDVGFPVPYDPEHRVYREWGLGRASLVGTYLSPSNVAGYARMIVGRGERLTRPGRDTLQLGGDFVISGDGTISFSHPQSTADDRPPVAVLVRELERVAGARGA